MIARQRPSARRSGVAHAIFAATVWAITGIVTLLTAAQAVTFSITSGVLRVRVPALELITGELLERLRAGQAQRVDFELVVLAGSARGSEIARAEESINLSFDLWEERFAATRPGTPPRSVSHLTARAAEAWCLEQLAIPTSELGRLSPGAPFWIRLTYRAPNPASVSDSEAADAFTLRRLIDLFSRREAGQPPERSIEAGPFRLSE